MGEKMVSRKNSTTIAVAFVACVHLSGCNSEPGFQGGLIPQNFEGITTIQAISPSSIQLSWAADPTAQLYNIYDSTDNTAFLQTVNTTVIFSPSQQLGTYNYSVTAMTPNGESGNRTEYSSVSLLPHFNFGATATVSALSNTQIKINWPGQPSVTYKFYQALKHASGAEDWQAFSSSSDSSPGDSSIVISNLVEGQEYCFVGIAAYSDGTSDGPDGNPLNTSQSASLQLQAEAGYVGGQAVSSQYLSSVVHANEKCARTPSSNSASMTGISVFSPKASLSLNPTFNVVNTSGSDTTITTAVYRVNPSSPTADFVGSIAGNGTFQSTLTHTPGAYQYYAIATKNISPSVQPQVRIELTVGTTTGTETNLQTVYVRNFLSPVATPANPLSPNLAAGEDTGYYPNKLSGGFGAQSAGSAVAMGDFNCDGKMDVAVGIPNAMTVAADGVPSQLGEVIIYYDVQQADGGTPDISNPNTRYQVIQFDLTSTYGDPSRNLRLGTSLYVDNFNGDTQATNQVPLGGPPAWANNSSFRCDDLVIGSGLGPFFVLYGKRDLNNPSTSSPVSGNNDDGFGGGLNFSNNVTINNPSPCSSTTNVCAPTVYLFENNNTFLQSSAMTSGDYNGDGYADLAVGVLGQGVWVFRGSNYGLIPPLSNSNTTFSTGAYVGFSQITSFGTGASALNASGNGAFKALSLGTIANSYYDFASRRVRDRLIVASSAPNFVYSCNATGTNDGTFFSGTAYIASNEAFTISATPSPGAAWGTSTGGQSPSTTSTWDCSLTLKAPGGGVFGVAMTNIKNALNYSTDYLCENGNLNPLPSSSGISTGCQVYPATFIQTASPPTLNRSAEGWRLGLPGAVAISWVSSLTSPQNSTGNVYLYYALANPDSSTFSSSTQNCANASTYPYYTHYGKSAGNTYIPLRDYNGCVLNNYMNSLLNPNTFTPILNDPCSLSASGENCSIQKINHPNPSLLGGFGLTLGSFPGNSSATNYQSTLLAGAAPYTSTKIGNTTYTNVGTVQIFEQNLQENPVSVCQLDSSSACSSIANIRYSDGFANNLTFSLDYSMPNLQSNINFGLGGIVGGPTFPGAGGLSYNTSSDILVGAPGYTAIYNPPAIGASPSPSPISIVDNGAGFLFFSLEGNYRTYQENYPSTVISPWHTLTANTSPENNLRYHEAVSLGNLINHGIDSVAVRISQGTNNYINIINGSSSSISLDRTSTSTLTVTGDPTAGYRIVPVGNIVQNGSYPAFLITAANKMYLYFSSVSGIILGTPSAFSAAGLPRSFGNNVNCSTAKPCFDFSDGTLFNSEQIGQADTYLNTLRNIVHGDFNGDGYDDIAIGFNTQTTIKGTGTTTYPSSLESQGRVMIFYGGANNGIQTQADSSGDTLNGTYPLTPSYFWTYGVTAATAPCDGLLPSDPNHTPCLIQMIYGQSTDTSFGRTLAAVPVGTCNGFTVSALVVASDTSASGSNLYAYYPTCLSTNGSVTGLFDNGTPTVLDSSSNTGLGTSLTAVNGLLGGTNASITTHLMATESYFLNNGGSITRSYKLHIYPVNSSPNSNSISGCSISGTTVSAATIAHNSIGQASNVSPAANYCGAGVIDYSSSPLVTGAAYDVGFGVGAVAAGDINGDGFADYAVSFSKLPLSTTLSSQPIVEAGAVEFLFGSSHGLQFKTNNAPTLPSQTASCYQNDISGQTTCNPTLVYLPSSSGTVPGSGRYGAYDRVFLSPYSYLDFSGIGKGMSSSLLIGSPGRDTTNALVSQRILNAGVFYVLP